jgi:hypothetical protein
MAKEKTNWRVRFMTDYPYLDTMVVEGDTEEEAWKDFEKKHGYPRNKYCSIEKI